MSNLGDFASGLVDEVLSEMAENFFGARKRMDRLYEEFERLRTRYVNMQAEALQKADTLHYLLGGGENAVLFYESIGFDPATLPFCLECSKAPVLEKLPFAFTLGGRYSKLVFRIYSELQDALRVCMHGRHEPHPNHPERLVLTLNHAQLKAFFDRINEAAERMNREMSASCVLRYAKGFSDPVEVEKERLTGAHCTLDPERKEGGLDKDFEYAPLVWEETGVLELPELPAPEEARPAIRAFCSERVRREREEVSRLLARLREARKQRG